MSNAVECRAVHKTFGKTRAVDAVTFALSKGQFMAVLGPSGCGKTTTLRMIAGLETPTMGEIALNGRLVFDSQTKVHIPTHLRQIGMVFQEYALFPHLTVEKNVGYGLANDTNRKARIQTMLALVGLDGLEKRYPQQLSGGQQQRVALARALATNPHTILLDEPFSNLDTGLRTQVREDVARIIREAGVSAILVTHDQSEALSFADEVAVMLDGKIAQIATPRHLYDAPISREVALFLGNANRIMGHAQGDSVQTALGVLPLQKPQQGPVEVFIRYRNVRAEKEGGTSAHIAHVVYQGNYQTLKVALPDDTLLTIEADPYLIFTMGEGVSLCVQGAVVAFPLLAPIARVE